MIPQWPQIVAPGPEEGWLSAPVYQGGNPNPALQYGLWDSAAMQYRPIAVLPPPLSAYAGRLLLEVEQSWEDLGDVDVASFRLRKRFLMLSQFTDAPDYGVTVWLDRRQLDEAEEALESLLGVLGVAPDVVRSADHCPHPAGAHRPALPDAGSGKGRQGFLVRVMRALRTTNADG